MDIAWLSKETTIQSDFVQSPAISNVDLHFLGPSHPLGALTRWIDPCKQGVRVASHFFYPASHQDAKHWYLTFLSCCPTSDERVYRASASSWYMSFMYAHQRKWWVESNQKNWGRDCDTWMTAAHETASFEPLDARHVTKYRPTDVLCWYWLVRSVLYLNSAFGGSSHHADDPSILKFCNI